MDYNNSQVFNWEQAIKLAGNKRELAEEMLALFIKDLPKDVIAIHQSYQDHNFVEMLRQVHKLHGALCYCGLPRLKTVVSRLETELKSNIMDSLPILTELLKSEVNLLLKQYSCLKT